MTKPWTRSSSKSASSGSIASLHSIQSHFSATSSQQRLRTSQTTSVEKSDKSVSVSPVDLESNDNISGIASAEPNLLSYLWSLLIRAWAKYPWVVFCVLVYCSLSAVVLGSSVTGFSFQRPATPHSKDTRSTSLLENLPMDHFLSKLISIHPQPKALHPYVLTDKLHGDLGVTACLWTRDIDLERLPNWVSRWTGSVSIVITTKSLPSSPEWKGFRRSLSKVRNNFSLNHSLSVHLLTVDQNAPENPNAYLNLARLLSPTSQVVLFPGNLSIVPPKAFYRSFFSNSSASARNVTSKPTIFTTRSQSSFPFSSLSPIALNRDDPLWCTERSFLHISREADWNDCLWQLWLEHYGDIDVKQTSDWVRPSVPESDMSLLPAKLRRRLGGKFRSETCMLETRRLAALRSPQSGGKDAKKARWLKRQCREWMTLA